MLTNDREKRICTKYSAEDKNGYVHCHECPLNKGNFKMWDFRCKANSHYDRHTGEWEFDEFKEMGFDDEEFSIGEYIIYVNGDKYEIGRIKSICEDGAFVAYHGGETGAKTPYSHMHKLINEYCIKETTLGGEYFERMK